MEKYKKRPTSAMYSSTSHSKMVNKYSEMAVNGNSSKENIMRRAEEEAARKIEEIERKARMRVI
jgi:hypothetical protein